MYAPHEFTVVDLYTAEGEKDERAESVPFVHHTILKGPQGESVRVRAVVDNSAMCGALDSTLYDTISHRLTPLQTSRRVLRMANGSLTPSRGVWKGVLEFAGVRENVQLEVFASGGAWQMLFGKPLLHRFNMKHDYIEDVITLQDAMGQTIRVPNQHGWKQKGEVIFQTWMTTDEPIPQDTDITVEEPQADLKTGEEWMSRLEDAFTLWLRRRPTVEEVPDVQDPRIPAPNAIRPGESPDEYIVWGTSPVASSEQRAAQADTSTTGAWAASDEGATEQPEVTLSEGEPFTRATDPFSTARIQRIQQVVEIGDDLSSEEREEVLALLAEYADVFALSLSEVSVVKGAVHKLNIPEGTKFNVRTPHSRSLKAPEREYLYPRIDEMERCGVIRRIDPADVKCSSQIVLAQKSHGTQGLTIEEIRQRLNEQCEAAGLPAEYPEVPRRAANPDSAAKDQDASKPPGYRICVGYKELNKVTKVASMPQGDIKAKQRALCGHRWIALFDFAAGFYAVMVDPESQPYTAFYVEGRGWYCFVRMPFGLTGAPSTFAQLTADALGDLVGRLIELFVDDGGMGGSEFRPFIENLRTLFQRCREKGLSLSAQKTRLFVSEAVFAGERVGKDGVRGDLTKLTAVVNWQRPTNMQNLAGFLGLTGYFRPLIKDYGRLHKPLKDLHNRFKPPPGIGKHAYRRMAVAYTLEKEWTNEHELAFIKLKSALVSDPVLRAPVFDGRPFIVTTDGCKDGFGGILSQRFEVTTSTGKKKMEVHPIAFASKRTSSSEERYHPYLLEFAALKHSLDKFDDIVYGFPIELETDCQAMRDTLLSDKLNATHVRWRDGVLAYHIVDVRHRPGITNTAADAISRQFTDTSKSDDDGHLETVSPNWEEQRGLENDIWAIEDEREYGNGGWMCQYVGVERCEGDGHEWSVSPDDSHTQGVDIFGVEVSAEHTTLRDRFANELIFQQVVDAFLELDKDKPVRDKRRARHRALGYQLDEGKLWRVGDGRTARSRARVECVSQAEAVELARGEHANNGHWSRDLIKIQLMDRICSPNLDQSITKAILDCGRCKAFGGAHMYSLLQPITRRQPMELLVGDYLAMPKGKGGFMEIGVFVDTFTQRAWGFKFKTHGTRWTTIACLNHIEREHGAPGALMVDGGSHFANDEVREWCTKRGVKFVVVSAYSPWVNGLCEGTNGRLLGRLKRLCAPDLGEDGWAKITSFEDLPRNWPEHLDDAIRSLNHRIIPAFKYSPHELFSGRIVNSVPAPLVETTQVPSAEDIEVQLARTQQQRLDAYAHITKNAQAREHAFNNRIEESHRKQIVQFRVNDLVQVY